MNGNGRYNGGKQLHFDVIFHHTGGSISNGGLMLWFEIKFEFLCGGDFTIRDSITGTKDAIRIGGISACSLFLLFTMIVIRRCWIEGLLLALLFRSVALVEAQDTKKSPYDENIQVLKSVEAVKLWMSSSKKPSEMGLLSPTVKVIQLCRFDSKECQDFAPLYSQLAQLVQDIFPLAVVDLSNPDSADLVQTLKVTLPKRSGPALFFRAQKKMIPYDTSKKDALNLQPLVQALMEQQGLVISSRAQSLNMHAPPPSSNEPSAVVELTDKSFAELVLKSNNKSALVAFTAPWCGHCTRLRPEWEAAAQQLRDEPVLLGWLDATKYTDLAQQYQVKGYPTIKLFSPGAAVQDYPGERMAGAIVQFMVAELERSGIPKEIAELTSPEVLERSCRGTNRICVLAVLPHILESSAAGRNQYRSLLSAVAKNFRAMSSLSFLWLEQGAQDELEQSMELTFGAPALVAYSMDKQAYAVMRQSFTEKSITAFLHSLINGRQTVIPLPASSGTPKVRTVEPWDGQDGAPVEEELSLEDIMGDEL
jgi:protein disulfide-isomerase-like protein